MQNNPTGAQKAFEEALPFMLNAGNFLGAVANLFYQARLAFYMGHHQRAETICQEWKKKFRDMATSSGLPEIPAARGLDIVQSLILVERNQLEEAERLLVKTLELLGWGSWMELHGLIVLARLRHLRGNAAGAQEVLRRMSRLGPQHAACAEAMEVLFNLKRSLDDQQVRVRAEAWTKKYAPDPSFSFALGIGPYHRDAEYFCNLAWARVQIALGNFQDAAIFITPTLQTARECGLVFRVAELAIAQALICDGLGDLAAALEQLERSLKIARACGYTRFLDESPELDRLLQQAAGRTMHAQAARELLASLHSLRSKENIAGTAVEVPDPLSERELEVLRLLATGLSPAEVAKKLFLSPFTLKAHTQNIYSKLGVHSRIEAINKARGMNLL
jgi:LuxR family maltose regulon positive regulatory protein